MCDVGCDGRHILYLLHHLPKARTLLALLFAVIGAGQALAANSPYLRRLLVQDISLPPNTLGRQLLGPQRRVPAAAELGHGHAQMMLGRYLSRGINDSPSDLRHDFGSNGPWLRELRKPSRTSLSSTALGKPLLTRARLYRGWMSGLATLIRRRFPRFVDCLSAGFARLAGTQYAQVGRQSIATMKSVSFPVSRLNRNRIE